MKTPMVPVSWGELIDKISILQLKEKNIAKEPALSNVRRELAELATIAQDALQDPQVARLKTELDAVNGRLWQIEDHLRAIEAGGTFGEEFIKLARGVYHNNDDRARLKREVNQHLLSDLIEEKSYQAY